MSRRTGFGRRSGKGAAYEPPAGRGVPQEPQGASIGQRNGLLRNYILRHLQSLFYALGQLSHRPFSTFMTAAVIGIALALPAGLHLLLKTAQQVTDGWDGATQVSLFLKTGVASERARTLSDELRRWPEIGAVQHISRNEALEEFRRLSGFGDALEALDDNPLPEVLVVRPVLPASGPEAVGRLLERLRTQPAVEMAQLDMQWVKRLYALMDIGRRGVWVLASMLALAVLLVVGNTIRLAIQNRRDEIVITKLIGGTDAFIRRPFLYSGFWYGLAGGVIAAALVILSVGMLQEPVRHLAGLYHSQFHLEAMDAVTALALLAGGAGLGLGGSWVAVGRHLRAIEPE